MRAQKGSHFPLTVCLLIAFKLQFYIVIISYSPWLISYLKSVAENILRVKEQFTECVLLLLPTKNCYTQHVKQVTCWFLRIFSWVINISLLQLLLFHTSNSRDQSLTVWEHTGDLPCHVLVLLDVSLSLFRSKTWLQAISMAWPFGICK